MKKLMSFALVAALFAVSCSQFEIDQTEVISANDAVFFLGANINTTKTVLGDKDGSTYPIEWQAGDKIYVNGAASNALTADQLVSATCAQFGFATELTEPFNSIYPASAVVAENTVEIPAVQAYVEGSYDPAAAIMVGTGSNPVDFACAVAFLKIKTTGAADAMIARAEVVALGGERLSGEFTTDYAALSSYADGKGSNAVAVVCATPVAAGTDIIVAIPAQTYASGIAITLQDAEGKAMFKKSTASFTAAAGKMYATELEYAPVALEGTITVDGTFTDWDSVPAVTYSLAPGTKSPVYNFKKMKITADDKFVYMYVEVDETYPNFGTYVDIFVDNDGDTATGGKLGSIEGYTGIPYTDSGLEWYIEGGCINGNYYVDGFAKYNYIGTDGAGIFSGLSNVTSSITSDQFAVSGSSDDKKIGRFEVMMDRKVFGFTGTKANLGIKNILSDTEAAGLLPQGASDGSDFVRVPMAPVAMKELATEPEPETKDIIVIDGEFEDWAAIEDLQTYTLPSGAAYDDARQMSVAFDDDYVYIYLDLLDNTENANGVVLDFYIDADADPLTGFYMNNQLGLGEGNLFLSSGIDWYMQSSLYNGASYFNLVKPGYFLNCTGGDGLAYGAATTVNHGSECTADKSFAALTGTDDDHIHMEWRLSREFFGMTGPAARFGLRYMNPGWTNAGVLPQKAAVDGAFAKDDMFTVIFDPNYVPEEPVVEPITIDGDFDDWADAEGVATYEVPADALYPDLYLIKAVASPKYLYLLVNAKVEAAQSRTYVVFNSDGDWNTGFNYYQGDTKLFYGGDFFIETYLHNATGVPNAFTSLAAANEWTNGAVASYSADKCTSHLSEVNTNTFSGKAVAEDGNIMCEWKIDRKLIGMTGNKGGVGIRYYNGWTITGVCPQKSANAGAFVPDEFEFTLPNIAK